MTDAESTQLRLRTSGPLGGTDRPRTLTAFTCEDAYTPASRFPARQTSALACCARSYIAAYNTGCAAKSILPRVCPAQLASVRLTTAAVSVTPSVSDPPES